MTTDEIVTDVGPTDRPAVALSLRPLTERVLARLGRPRPFWILAWGLLSFAAYEVVYRFFQAPTYPEVPGQRGGAVGPPHRSRGDRTPRRGDSGMAPG